MIDRLWLEDDQNLLNYDPQKSWWDKPPEEYPQFLGLEWMAVNLNRVTNKLEFFNLISARSTLKSVTEFVHISMPEDLEFSNMDVKVCKLRWLMKICVIISITLVNLQWFEFTIISHTIIKFYDTTAEFVNWTSLIYMLCYVVFTFPVSYLLDNRIVVR